MQHKQIRVSYSPAFLSTFKTSRSRRKQRNAYNLCDSEADKQGVKELNTALENYESEYSLQNDEPPTKRKEINDEIIHLRTILNSSSAAQAKKDSFAKRFWWISRSLLEPPRSKKILRFCYNKIVKIVSWFMPRARSWFWKKSVSEKFSDNVVKKITRLCYTRRSNKL